MPQPTPSELPSRLDVALTNLARCFGPLDRRDVQWFHLDGEAESGEILDRFALVARVLNPDHQGYTLDVTCAPSRDALVTVFEERANDADCFLATLPVVVDLAHDDPLVSLLTIAVTVAAPAPLSTQFA